MNKEKKVWLFGKKNAVCSEGLYSYHDFENYAERKIRENTEDCYAIVCVCVSNLEFINNVFGLEGRNNAVNLVRTNIMKMLGNISIAASYEFESFVILFHYQKEEDISTWLVDLVRTVAEEEYRSQGNYAVCIHSGVFLAGNEPKLGVKEMIDRASIAQKRCFGFEKQTVFYEEDMRKEMLKEAEIVKSMNYAIENNEFKIYLQPQHHLQQNDVVLSAEALVRWVKEDGQIIHPNEFIPALEKNGLIAKLDRHVMELACRFISQHMDEPWCGNISIAVNVSKVDLKQTDFIRYYTEMKNRYRIPDGLIEIEFTESAVFEDYTVFKDIMNELHKHGFSCALDDFGAGSSSLNVLKELPVDVLKMDRLFFTGEESYDKHRDNSVIASVVAMARGLGMKIIAEGIENVDQIDFLRRIGCDIIQGFVYSKPLPVDDFIQYVKNYKPRFIVKRSIQNKVLPDKGLKDNVDALYDNYLNTLRYVHALVVEVDMEGDKYRVISLGSRMIHISYATGNYSDFYDEMVQFSVLPKYKEIISKCTLSNIVAACYRGDDKISVEFEARISNEDDIMAEEIAEWFSLNIYINKYSDGEIGKAILFLNNIEIQKEKELSFVKSEQRLYDIISSLYVTVLEFNLKDNYLRVIKNTDSPEKWVAMTGSSYEEQFMKLCDSGVIYEEDMASVKAVFSPGAIIELMKGNDDVKLEYRVNSPYGFGWREASLTSLGDIESILCCIRDVTRVKQDQYAYGEKNIIDKLTKTYNKEGFMGVVSEYLKGKGKNGNHILLVVDIDDFRLINRKSGHTFGDMLLCNFVQSMKRINRKDDIIGRIGGDEFAVFLKDIKQEDLPLKLERIRKVFDAQTDNGYQKITFSMGIAFYPEHSDDVRVLYSDAFSALADAKRAGQDHFVVYTEHRGDIDVSLDNNDSMKVSAQIFDDHIVSSMFQQIYSSDSICEGIEKMLQNVGLQYELGGVCVFWLKGRMFESRIIWEDEREIVLNRENEILDTGWFMVHEPDLFRVFQGEDAYLCEDVDLLSQETAVLFHRMRISAFIAYPIVKKCIVKGILFFTEKSGSRMWLVPEQETASITARMLAGLLDDEKFRAEE